MLLPPELINHIFSFLREDISALNACSKAHPLYSRLAEPHLYADIVVRLYDPPGVSELYNQFINNSRILRYPRSLKVIGNMPLVVHPSMLPIISMIPRMVNLISFCLYGLGGPSQTNQYIYGQFISTLRDSLQQSSIEQFCHHRMVYPPFTHSTANEEYHSLQALDSLVITGLYNQDALSWATHREPRLMSPNNTMMVTDLSPIPELLTACSHSLTSLHINVGGYCQGTYIYDANCQLLGSWIADDDLANFPFTLSALTCLKKLSIFTVIGSSSEGEIEIYSSFPAIMRLIKTAPSIQHVILSIYYEVWGPAVISLLDWSPLAHLQSENSAIRFPRIDIYVNGEGRNCPISEESILYAFEQNDALMDLVDRGVVTIKLGSMT